MTAERKVTVTVTAPHGEPLRVADLRDLVSLLPPGMNAPAVVALMGERGSQRDPEPYLRGLSVVYDPQALDPPFPDGPSVSCPDHKPRQHRDGKPPWCDHCGQP